MFLVIKIFFNATLIHSSSINKVLLHNIWKYFMWQFLQYKLIASQKKRYIEYTPNIYNKNVNKILIKTNL